MSAAWWLGLLLAVLRLSVPYVMAALGGTVCERAGVINIALEGFLLISALGTALGASHGALAAVGCGLAAGVAFAGLYALAVVVLRGDQIVSGVALFMLADGLSRVLLKAVYGSTSNSPRLAALDGHGPTLFLLAAVFLIAILRLSVLQRAGSASACRGRTTASSARTGRVGATGPRHRRAALGTLNQHRRRVSGL